MRTDRFGAIAIIAQDNKPRDFKYAVILPIQLFGQMSPHSPTRIWRQ